MKKLLFILLLSPLFGIAQYRESGDTIFVNNKVLVPGDTVHLGMGSDPYKNFVFVNRLPSKKMPNTNGLSSGYSLTFLVYKGLQDAKIIGRKILMVQTFWINNIDNFMSHYYIKIPQAIAAKEIIL